MGYPFTSDHHKKLAPLWQNYTVEELAEALILAKLKAEQTAIKSWYPTLENYVTGTGQKMKVHAKNADCEKGCVIHNPTRETHKDWPTHWRSGEYLMERICPHGVGHPDKDHLAFVRKTKGDAFAYGQSIHGCDGCCRLLPDGGFVGELARALGV